MAKPSSRPAGVQEIAASCNLLRRLQGAHHPRAGGVPSLGLGVSAPVGCRRPGAKAPCVVCGAHLVGAAAVRLRQGAGRGGRVGWVGGGLDEVDSCFFGQVVATISQPAYFCVQNFFTHLRLNACATWLAHTFPGLAAIVVPLVSIVTAGSLLCRHCCIAAWSLIVLGGGGLTELRCLLRVTLMSFIELCTDFGCLVGWMVAVLGSGQIGVLVLCYYAT